MTATSPHRHVAEPTTALRRRIAWTRALAALLWAAVFVAVLGSNPDAAATVPTGAAILLVAYPLIDVVSWVVEGGERRVLPATVSLAAAVALAVAAVAADAGAVLAIFGVWAVVSGALQLAAAIARRSAGGHELPMIASGAISVLAGVSFVVGSTQDVAPLKNLAGYAVFGAVFFAVWAARARG